jgi:spermidine synthase
VVEIGDEVIETAHDWFALPRDAPRLRTVHADARDFLERPAEQGRYGVVQVDLYDMHARGPVLDSLAFYRACRKALADPGVCVVNLFGEHETFAPNIDRIARAFDGRILALPPTEEGNRIVFAFSGPTLSVDWQSLLERAALLQSVFELRAAPWVRDIRRMFCDAAVFSV